MGVIRARQGEPPGRQRGRGGRVLGESLHFGRQQVSRLDSVPPGHVISDKLSFLSVILTLKGE